MGRRARAAGAALVAVMIGLAAALAVPAVGGAAGEEAPAPVTVGDEAPAEFEFELSPTLLPPGDPGAIGLTLGFEVNAADSGSTPRPVSTTIGLDRSIGLEPGNLRVCGWRATERGIQIQATGHQGCPRASVVGRAKATIKLGFPETQPEIPAVGKIYNGGTRGRETDLLIELSVGPPLDRTVALLASVRPARRGRIGSKMTIGLPTIDGFAWLKGLQLGLMRGFNQDGARTGYVRGECRDGKVVATFHITFAFDAQYSQESIRACGRTSSMQH